MLWYSLRVDFAAESRRGKRIVDRLSPYCSLAESIHGEAVDAAEGLAACPRGDAICPKDREDRAGLDHPIATPDLDLLRRGESGAVIRVGRPRRNGDARRRNSSRRMLRPWSVNSSSRWAAWRIRNRPAAYATYPSDAFLDRIARRVTPPRNPCRLIAISPSQAAASRLNARTSVTPHLYCQLPELMPSYNQLFVFGSP